MNQTECMIRRVYILFIAPLTIYLGRSFLRYMRSLSVTNGVIFLPLFTELVLARDFRIDPHLLFVFIILLQIVAVTENA